MNCTHPVLYNHPDGLRCHICGALIEDKPAEPEGQEEKQTPKRKRKAKGADGNENR